MYEEIKELYKYCCKIGINCKFMPMFDGYTIRFKDGDVIQHALSYGGEVGCVEFAIGCDDDYTACTLNDAKSIVDKYKDKL